jgi:hypothetical protein
MSLNPPPSPKFQVLNGIMFVQTWYQWFLEVYRCVNNLPSGNPTDFKPYCVSGSGSDITTTATTVLLSSVQESNTNYSNTSGEITLTEAGTYCFSYSIEIDEDSTSGATRRRCNAHVEEDGTTITQSQMATYTREGSGGAGISNSFIHTVATNSVIRIRIQMDASGPDTSVESAQLSIMKLA